MTTLTRELENLIIFFYFVNIFLEDPNCLLYHYFFLASSRFHVGLVLLNHFDTSAFYTSWCKPCRSPMSDNWCQIASTFKTFHRSHQLDFQFKNVAMRETMPPPSPFQAEFIISMRCRRKAKIWNIKNIYKRFLKYMAYIWSIWLWVIRSQNSNVRTRRHKL